MPSTDHIKSVYGSAKDKLRGVAHGARGAWGKTKGKMLTWLQQHEADAKHVARGIMTEGMKAVNQSAAAEVIHEAKRQSRDLSVVVNASDAALEELQQQEDFTSLGDGLDDVVREMLADQKAVCMDVLRSMGEDPVETTVSVLKSGWNTVPKGSREISKAAEFATAVLARRFSKRAQPLAEEKKPKVSALIRSLRDSPHSIQPLHQGPRRLQSLHQGTNGTSTNDTSSEWVYFSACAVGKFVEVEVEFCMYFPFSSQTWLPAWDMITYQAVLGFPLLIGRAGVSGKTKFGWITDGDASHFAGVGFHFCGGVYATTFVSTGGTQLCAHGPFPYHHGRPDVRIGSFDVALEAGVSVPSLSKLPVEMQFTIGSSFGVQPHSAGGN